MYVKWFDTVMFYYISEFSECHFLSFSNFPPFCPVRPYVAGAEPRRQIPASAGGHCRGHCRRDITGAQDKVREEQIPEQRHMIFPSVARGYRLRYTREYRQGG
ncbi:unnamed protein product [Staurois parvus]|uniref:Uncharacterized protein n=1 Tax=Staurois parvus TaxID=386267 RepID=A0ABN9C8B2_9NEOB|nr:unnamed protein product [Staurois parvus]